MAPRAHIAFPRILAASPDESLRDLTEAGSALGFRQALLWSGDDPSRAPLVLWDGTTAPAETAGFVQAAHGFGADPWIELAIDSLPIDHELVRRLPACFAIRHALAERVVDPRRLEPPKGRALARFDLPESVALVEAWSEAVSRCAAQGFSGFFVRCPAAAPPSVWRTLIEAARAVNANAVFLADTVGMDRLAIAGLAGRCDFTLSSLPWWDGRARWLVEEHAALSALAPAVALLGAVGVAPPRSAAGRIRLARLAAVTGAGMLMPLGFARLPGGETDEALADAIRAVNAMFDSDPVVSRNSRLRSLSGAGAPVSALLRTPGDAGPLPESGLLALINPDALLVAPADPVILVRTGGELALPAAARHEFEQPLAPGEVRLVTLRRARQVKSPRRDETEAARDPRIVIDAITPSADNGAFAVKRLFGETLIVEADIFGDGHEKLAAEILFRPEDGKTWSRVPMASLVNDRWQGQFALERLGRYVFAVEAWIDAWGGFIRDLGRKRDAGLDLTQDIAEGRELIEAAIGRASARTARALSKALAAIDEAGPGAAEHMLAPDLAAVMATADPRRFRAISPTLPVQVDRQAAQFAAWYELFPRSQTTDPARPGTLRDVIERLPDIGQMGFDVLYFPPIHPIGRQNRKGRNNSLAAGPDDPGSPYAIGAAEGGHDAIHPELGDLDDFRALVAAAHENGMEIALDFAVQCSPDHPWLKDHPEWFAWRPDGSIKYAENPPKKYEDIVNVDFYAPAAIPGLWRALRDVIAFWIAEGVRIFRVDNPHTKPLPFWEWLIADIRAVHPETIFLAEAFTRPKLMYRLAKLGFSQSYTYFTWRNTKAELTEYLTELTRTEVREFFRPHFFVNTPDINPYFLQTSGRVGFLIRAALAATLSGLWGVYSGFELCEFEPLPGREEYKNSEKYEIRPRDWAQPGNIVAEIAQLNRVRKAEPALQSHLGLTFYNAFDDGIIYFGKSVPGQPDKILVAISLDPHRPREADFEVPLWEWGLPDDGRVEVADLINGQHFIWNGKMQHVRLTEQSPYAIWRAQPAMEA